MTQPTLFVDKMGTKEGDPIRMAIRMISQTFKATLVPEYTTADNVEADIIIVSSAARALHYLKETENATIGIFIFPKAEVPAATALANRYPDRVRAMGWEEFVPSLLTLIGEKTKKEEADANPARG